MFSHIKSYAFTKKAFKALIPDGDLKNPKFPSLWFDWSIPGASDANVRTASLRRFTVVENTQYDAARAQWVRDSNALGILPVLVATVDDNPPDAGWPSARAEAFMMPINRSPDDDESNEAKWYAIDDWEDKVAAIVPLDARAADELSAFRNELALPERSTLAAWVGIALNEKEEFWEIEAHPIAWFNYAQGLKQWVNQAKLWEEVLEPQGEAPYHQWNSKVALSWDDFDAKPSVDEVQQSLAARKPLLIACKWAPFCGIGIDESGAVTTFGMLPVNAANSSWPFADDLRLELDRLRNQARTPPVEAADAPNGLAQVLPWIRVAMSRAVAAASSRSGGGGTNAGYAMGLAAAHRNSELVPRRQARSPVEMFKGEFTDPNGAETVKVTLWRLPRGDHAWELSLSVSPSDLMGRVEGLQIGDTKVAVAQLKDYSSRDVVHAKEIQCLIRKN
jgi:hypothetical protein